jgi:HNH endonuclease
MIDERPCRECGKPIALKIQRDLERKFYCSHACRSRYLGKQRDQSHLWKAGSTPEANAKKGRKKDQHPLWKPIGSRYVRHDGYTKIKTENGWEYEHRLVAGALPGEQVHHRDGNPRNNDPANLERVKNSSHQTYHGRKKTEFGDRWAWKWDCCRVCGGTERKHLGKGLCSRCYQRSENDVSIENAQAGKVHASGGSRHET